MSAEHHKRGHLSLILNGMAHNAPETDEDTADGETVRLQYEGLRREYARLLADAEKGAANDPENQEIQSRLTKLQRIQSAPTMANILNTISGLSRDNIQRNMKVNQFMNHRYRRADGSSYKIPNSAAYRDSAQFAKPIGQTADVTQEEMYNLCDNFHILKEGKHLDGTDAGENQPKSAMARELELQRAAYREIREYTDARPEIFHNPNFSQKDFSKAADECERACAPVKLPLQRFVEGGTGGDEGDGCVFPRRYVVYPEYPERRLIWTHER